jgi:hypothetical protein
MNIWTELGTSEAGLLVVLALLGAGPASLLSARFDGASRVALAPVLGFCAGTCLTTTLLQFFAANDTYLVLVAAMVVSVAFAVGRTLETTDRTWISLRDAAQLLVVCVAVIAPLTAVLHERHTVGPAAYYFTDVDNYVGTQQAAGTTSLHDARQQWIDSARSGGRFANLTDRSYAFLADFGSNLDATPLHANVNALLGKSAIDTFAPFLIVLLLIGGLGAFAAVRYILERPSWMAALAGALFGGPLFLELWFDNFQAAIIALALLLPAVVLGTDAVRTPRRGNLALIALVMACFITVYPLFIPPLVAIAVAALAWRAVVDRRAGASPGSIVSTLALPALVTAVLTVVFDPVAVVRTVGYYNTLAHGGVPLPRVGFKLPPDVLPGWLLQTREFWFLTPLNVGGFKQILLGALIPLVLLAFAVVAVRRHRVALALLGLAAIVAVLAYGAYASQDACTYCGERYLLALAPILAVLLAVGLAVALGSPSRMWKVVGIGGVVLVVAAVGQRTRVELDRFADTSYFFDTANRSALQALPADGKPLQVEGYWAGPSAQAEQPLAYHLATNRAGSRVSLSLGSAAGNALQYLDFGQVLPPGPEFHADYRYVLTRFSGVATDRRLIVRRGPVSLLERTQPLDVTPYTGLGLPQARLDGSGVPWVQPGATLGFYVVGAARDRVWARLTFDTATPIRVPKQHGVRARSHGTQVTVCVPATGKAPIRNAAVAMPVVAVGAVRLTAMHAVSGRCRV